ncbi:MAG TPA: type II CAAX endopeptidase family protein, partial [Chitinophagaceae bacterium]|nr:type II CAAX endopeptidase family protein [Chitinophagaceae bacterium]
EMKAERQQKPLIPYGWVRALLLFAAYLGLTVLINFLLPYLQTNAPAADPAQAQPSLLPYLYFIIAALVSFALVWVFLRFIDRQPFSSIGLSMSDKGTDALTALLLGIFLLCAGASVLFFTGQLRWTDNSFNGNELFISFGLLVIIALYEEVVFRGYVLNNLLNSVPRWPAIGISALAFTLAHVSNPSFAVLPLINILLAGVLLGINYSYTKNLWFSTCLHFAWNFMQGPVMGFQVSGLPFKSLLSHSLQGDEIVTGGKFGFEGSVVATALYLLAIALLVWAYQRKKVIAAAPVLQTK